MRRRPGVGRLLTAIVVALVVDASASGQTSRPDRAEGADGSEAPRGVLAGPKVEESEKGSGVSFLERRRERQGNEAGAARQWLRLVGQLELSDEQRDRVRAEVGTLARERRRFQREHGEAFRALEKEIREARRSKRDVPREKAVRMQELRALAPRPDAAQERIWAMLTPEQQTELRSALARRRAERETRRERDRVASPDDGAAASEMDVDEASRRRLRFLERRRASDG